MDKMIYCQKDIPKDRLRYGLRASAATGCGWWLFTMLCV